MDQWHNSTLRDAIYIHSRSLCWWAMCFDDDQVWEMREEKKPVAVNLKSVTSVVSSNSKKNVALATSTTYLLRLSLIISCDGCDPACCIRDSNNYQFVIAILCSQFTMLLITRPKFWFFSVKFCESRNVNMCGKIQTARDKQRPETERFWKGIITASRKGFPSFEIDVWLIDFAYKLGNT